MAAAKRTYADPCGVARALDVVGERWTMLIVRELLFGPKRFTDLRAGLPLIGPDVLSQRLRELEQAGVVRRRTLPPPAASRVYELTERGHELEPVLIALGRWGSRAGFPVTDQPLSIDALVLALETLFDAQAAVGLDALYELRLGEQTFTARVIEGRLELARATADTPAATIAAEPHTLSRVLWHGAGVERAQRTGALVIDGDGDAARRFLALFPRPQPATVS